MKTLFSSTQTVLYGALAGAIGGAIGWLPAELVAIPQPASVIVRYVLIVLYFVIIGGCIGASISALDGMRARLAARALAGARLGAVLGVIGGALGSLPGELAFQGLSVVHLGLVGRAVGWAIVGVLIGITQGLINRDRVRIVRGGLGGLLGGYLGGGCFELVSLALAGGAFSRWVAVVVLGLFLGALITFFQEWLSNARLTVINSGVQEGAAYDLTKAETSVGNGDGDDFVLHAGEGVTPNHAHILQKTDGYWIQPINPQYGVRVNKQLVQGEQRLRHENEIGLGSMLLRFTEQTVRCPGCGKDNAVRAHFCLGCGRALTTKA